MCCASPPPHCICPPSCMVFEELLHFSYPGLTCQMQNLHPITCHCCHHYPPSGLSTNPPAVIKLLFCTTQFQSNDILGTPASVFTHCWGYLSHSQTNNPSDTGQHPSLVPMPPLPTPT